MKRSLFSVCAVGIACAFAGWVFASSSAPLGSAPRWINYQGRLTTPTGAIVPDGAKNAEFKLFTSLSGGTEVWTETKSISIKQGVFTTQLGNSTPLDPELFESRLWLQVSLDGQPIGPRQEFGAVGFAMMAHTVPDGAISAAKLADGAVTSDKLAIGALKLPVHFASGPTTPYWPVPPNSVWTTIPGLTVTFQTQSPTYLDISFTGLVSQTIAGKATYTNIYVNGVETTVVNGVRHLGGARVPGWNNASNVVVVPVAAGTHTVQVRVQSDSDSNSAEVHSGFLRVVPIPR